ncbi:MAG: isoprenylcysteine carboxylmethyltransferase family protein [Candidatus Thorarchaeota archaeon]|nr:MAG: isoprenylcysteine carboxylmethyltransferase family protein [Candidatus Thorarchaeota archaeon]
MVMVIEWINFMVLVGSTILFLYFYVKSVSPAQLEKKIGDSAYPKCKTYRIIAGGFEGITIINYMIYFFYPLPLGLQLVFPWDWIVSILVGIIILIPSVYLMVVGMKDAGRETLEPKKEHTLYGGVYETVRHPQAIGEAVMWFPIALFLNSLFLVLYSFVWIPIFYITCVAEERDLVIRYGAPYLEYRDRVGFLIPKRSQK